MKRIEKHAIAQEIAQERIESVEFLDVVDALKRRGIDATEKEKSEIFSLVWESTAVVESKKRSNIVKKIIEQRIHSSYFASVEISEKRVEECAKALHIQRNLDTAWGAGDWNELSEDEKNTFRRETRAVLEADIFQDRSQIDY